MSIGNFIIFCVIIFLANVAQIVFVAVPPQFAVAPQPQPQIIQVPIAPADKVYIPPQPVQFLAPQPVQVLEQSKFIESQFLHWSFCT